MELPVLAEMEKKAIVEHGWSFGYCIHSEKEFKRLFVGDCQDKQIREELVMRANSEMQEALENARVQFSKQFTELYHKWTIEHNDIPYQYVTDVYERRLAQWYHDWCKRNGRIDSIELLKKTYFNYIRRYKEWTFKGHGKRPSIRTRSNAERKLARWAIDVQERYAKDLLTPEYVQEIIDVLGKDWLNYNKPQDKMEMD